MAAITLFDVLAADLATARHKIGFDSYKVALTLTAPDAAADTDFADLAEIAAGNGYSAGGAVTSVAVTQTGAQAKVTASDVTVTASGGAIAGWRYAVLYNATSGALVAYWDAGSTVTLADGSSATLDFDATAGVLVIG